MAFELSPLNLHRRSCVDVISAKIGSMLPSRPAEGFTLAEVLITLGIIGVVAAITIPGLIQKNQANKLKSQYLKAYSEIAQSIKLMKNDDVSLDTRTYGSGNSFYKTFYTYFKNAHLCGNGISTLKKEMCLHNGDTSYKTLDGKSSLPLARFDDGQFVLMDGALVLLENPYSIANPTLWIHVDINGKTQKPNRWGIDLFTFYMNDDEEIVPMGAKGTPYNSQDLYCNPSKTNLFNGAACSVKAMSDSDYFQKAVKWIK